MNHGLVAALVCLSACTFDFDAFTGGAGGTSNTVSSSSVAGGSGGEGTGAVGTGGVGAGPSTGGSGGQPGLAIPRCGDIADDFQVFPGSIWSHTQPLAFSIESDGLNVDPPGNLWSGAWLTDGQAFDACAFTLALRPFVPSGYVTFDLNGAGPAKVVLELDQTVNGRRFTLSGEPPAPEAMVDTPLVPEALALVLDGGQIHGLFASGGKWMYVGNVQRPGGFESPFTSGFGSNVSVTFDDFGLVPIRTTDVPGQ